MKSIETPVLPKMLLAADEATMQLYIIHREPYALIWVCQTTPATLYIVEGKQDENILKEAAKFYKERAAKTFDSN